MAMASEHKNIGKRKSPLADCTNTPPLSRPRRACGTYASPTIDAQFTLKRSADPENQSNDVGSTATPTCHLTENSSSDQNFSTPQTVLPAVDSSPLPKENENESFTDFRVYSKRRRSKGRALETLSSSCPPLRRPSSDSSAVERSHQYRSQSAEVRKRRPIDASTDLTESGRLKVRRWRNLMPTDGGRCSFPESFVREQQAHFAETDAFALQKRSCQMTVLYSIN